MVHVDNDPIAVMHSSFLIGNSVTIGVVDGDLTDTNRLVHQPEIAQLLDFSHPVGVLQVAVLYFLNDEEVQQAVATIIDAIASGSYLIISHEADDHDERRKELARPVYRGRIFPRIRE